MEKRKKEGFKTFVSDLLQESMLTGIPQIISAGNVTKRLIRVIIFIVCLIGFIYQSIRFMEMYWKYETIMDVKVTNPDRIDLPSMTICNYNGFNLSKICADTKHEHVCRELKPRADSDWCNCRPKYCENGKLKPHRLPVMEAMRNMTSWPYEDYKKYLIPFNKTFESCGMLMINDVDNFAECNSYYQNIRCPHQTYGLMNVCYTINTLIERPNEEPKKVLSRGRIFIGLNTQSALYHHELSPTESMQVSFHHPREVISPYEQGFTMYPDYKYYFRLKKVVKHLLPPPYDTDCIDYLDMWRSRGGRGPMNQKSCILECHKNASLEAFGCVEDSYKGPGNERRCRLETGLESVKPLLPKIRECTSRNCKPACYEENYEVAKYSIKRRIMKPECKQEFDESDVTLTAFFNGMETTTYTYSPKIEIIETFSYVGGYIGIWLGISLIAVFDFLEAVVIMLKYPFQRFALYKKRKNRINQLTEMHRNL